MIKKKTKKALILGISGQDGTHISYCLLKQNMEVHGISRKKTNCSNNRKLKNILKKVKVFKLKKNISNLIKILRKFDPRASGSKSGRRRATKKERILIKF